MVLSFDAKTEFLYFEFVTTMHELNIIARYGQIHMPMTSISSHLINKYLRKWLDSLQVICARMFEIKVDLISIN